MPKTMAPFPTLPPRPCRNPDCGKTCTNTAHKAGEDGRHMFSPRTPWQSDCSPECRNRYHYLFKTKPKRSEARKESEKSDDEKRNPS